MGSALGCTGCTSSISLQLCCLNWLADHGALTMPLPQGPVFNEMQKMNT